MIRLEARYIWLFIAIISRAAVDWEGWFSRSIRDKSAAVVSGACEHVALL